MSRAMRAQLHLNGSLKMTSEVRVDQHKTGARSQVTPAHVFVFLLPLQAAAQR